MYELIVLGYVPGTHIQITFGIWLLIAGIFAMLTFVWNIRRGSRLSIWIITFRIMLAIRHATLTRPNA